MRTLERMPRVPSPWRPRDLHVAGVIARAWDGAGWTYDVATERTGIGRNRLQHIRATTGSAISVGEGWVLCEALELDALEVLDGGDGRPARAEVTPLRPAAALSDPSATMPDAPIAAQTRNVQEEYEGGESD